MLYTATMILPHDRLRVMLEKAISRAYPDIVGVEVTVEPAKDVKHGDYASTVALRLAPHVKQPPLEVAKHLVVQLGMAPMLEKAEVAPPGFINFFLKPGWLQQQVPAILKDTKYGVNTSGGQKKILVEFISANPTGPMTLGNGRGAFGGDALANVLTLNGWKVWREFYLNDVGNQVNILAESVIRRYFQLQGIPTDYPDNCYQGGYVTELAAKLKIEKLKIRDMTALRDRIKKRVLETMVKDIQRVVDKKLGITFNTWFRESTLHQKKLDRKALDVLKNHDLLYTKDGATWFRTTAFGDDKDRVIVKSDGKYAYIMGDVALHYYRFAIRGFDREIMFLGADHHGFEGRLQAGMSALGYAKKLDIQFLQLVKLIKDGQEVKMSKRAGTYVTLEEVVDEVGIDVARFFFLMHAANSHMDFNLSLAKEHSDKNPVFYVQYAHARISSILKKTVKLKPMAGRAEIHPSETALAKALFEFPPLVAEIGESYEVQKLPFYAMALAAKFHDYYTHSRVIDNNQVWPQRLILVKATKMVLAKTLGLMGVSVPDTM